MAEKVPSNYLLNLERQFAQDHPVLQKAVGVFQELDQIEFDLGLIEDDETTASKQSWWPIISLIGGNSTAKSRFMNGYLGAEQLFSGIQTSSHKFTVLMHSHQVNTVTLPATAMDVDPRYPFYKVSEKIERFQEGEGGRINTYLELKTINSERLKGRLFIDAPNVMTPLAPPVISMLLRYSIENSDLVMVFIDAFEQEAPLVYELMQIIIEHQDTNKFVYLIEGSGTLGDTENKALWQRRLAEIGIKTGQFIVLPNQESAISPAVAGYYAEIDLRLSNVRHDRSYRVLDALEKNIHDVENVIIPEVRQAIVAWKERVNITSLVVLSFIATLAIFAEIEIGLLELLIDPVIGPVSLIGLIAVMTPVHLLGGKLQAKLIANRLNARQKELQLQENLAMVFEKNQTFLRTMLPLIEPMGWNKKTRLRLAQLSEKTKQLVQMLNDDFSGYAEASVAQPADTQSHKNYP